MEAKLTADVGLLLSLFSSQLTFYESEKKSKIQIARFRHIFLYLINHSFICPDIAL